MPGRRRHNHYRNVMVATDTLGQPCAGPTKRDGDANHAARRAVILAALEDGPARSADLAEALNIADPSVARRHAGLLEDEGLVHVVAGGRGRSPLVFELTEHGRAQLGAMTGG